MAASSALLLSFNLIFFTLISSSTNVLSSETYKHPPPNSPSAPATCPRDVLKFRVCADFLNFLMHLVMGVPPKKPCCSLVHGLADFEAAVCLCTAIKANIMGIDLNIPISMSLLLNNCGKNVPRGFQCA
uniref:Putative proline-rich protein DC2.15-like n=1 Tax=Davidia involucrata TaxID=16924 RepID=A0A5B7BRV8_DAVIN